MQPALELRRDVSLADDVVVFIDVASDERSGARADERPEGLGASRGDDVPEHAAGDAADDQSRRPVVTTAVITIVRASIDAIVPAKPSRLPIATPIVTGCVVTGVSGLDAVVVVILPLAVVRTPGILVLRVAAASTLRYREVRLHSYESDEDKC
jgi:hypothetical protein